MSTGATHANTAQPISAKRGRFSLEKVLALFAALIGDGRGQGMLAQNSRRQPMAPVTFGGHIANTHRHRVRAKRLRVAARKRAA